MRRIGGRGHAFAVAGVLLAAGLAVSACGIPIAASPTAIPQSQVPAALSVAPATLPPNPDLTGRTVSIVVYLVNTLQELVPTTIAVKHPGSFQAILNNLAAGPDAKAASLGYGTDLPSGVVLTAIRVSKADVAEVAVGGGFLAQVGQPAIGEYAQVVCTLMASLPIVGFPHVRSVQFYSGGLPTGALLTDGQLVEKPVTANEYRDLLAPAA